MFYQINIDPIAEVLGAWSQEVGIGSIIWRICLAILLSFILGIERSARNQAAGVRTFILVTLGSTIAMMTNQFIFETFETGDASRLGAQVISGIGFLGAGTIMVTSRSQIRGLTTAAGLWASACMGLAVGVGFYTLAIIGTISIFLVFTILQSLESYLKDISKSFTIYVELNNCQDLKNLINYIRNSNIVIQRVEMNQAYKESGLAVYTIFLYNKNKGLNNMRHMAILNGLRKLEYVNYVEEIS